MKVIYLLPFALLFLANCSGNGDTETESDHVAASADLEISDFHHYYSGKIDGQYEIEMWIHANGSKVKGYYLYTKYGTQIPLEGTLNKVDKTIQLAEYGDPNSSESTGTFEGTFDNELGIFGKWKGAEGKNELSFELTKEKELFTWFTVDVPFHPYYVSNTLPWEGDGEPVEFTNLEIEGVEYEEGELTPILLWEDSAGYDLDYGEDVFVMRAPYFSYDVLAQEGDKFIISTSECGGGTGIFSDIRVLEVKGNTIEVIDNFASGDRCTGGLMECTYEKGMVYYSSNITPEDLFLYGFEGDIPNYDIVLDWCAMCCIGTADYEYSLKTGDIKLNSITVDLEYYGPLEGYPPAEQCFFDSLAEYVENNSNQIPIKEYEKLIQNIMDSCAIPILPEEEED
ncbi:MAG: hypothetical protein H6600_04700 [Flavobacteriales bacterium]|nr:hypothetical protein [Flavobacteriales bacterium]MCB9196732.1 hypothetical protein [Flavobacteriales bacterium]MCB9197735.1 hypothetical protein [Flavobacteriales bacterium]